MIVNIIKTEQTGKLLLDKQQLLSLLMLSAAILSKLNLTSFRDYIIF